MKRYWTAERIWPDSTIVCIGGGPSLALEQVNWCRARREDPAANLRVIAINDAYRLAPFADVLYFCDDRWWNWHQAKLVRWERMIVRLEGGGHDFGDPRIKVLRNVDLPPAPGQPRHRKGGLSEQRDGLRTGKNSGYQAINLAVHLGAKRILLLGYDMGVQVEAGRVRTHWFGDHPGGTSDRVYDTMLPWFDTLPVPLAQLGVEIVNCTEGGRLRAFPRKPLQEVLPEPYPQMHPDPAVNACLVGVVDATVQFVKTQTQQEKR